MRIQTSGIRLVAGYLSPVIFSVCCIVTWFQTFEGDLGPPETLTSIVEFGLMVFVFGSIYSIIFAAIPFILLLKLGRLLRIEGLPYSLLTGALSAEWVWLGTFGVSKIMMPGEPFANGLFLSAVMNISSSLAGIVGGFVFWWMTLRQR